MAGTVTTTHKKHVKGKIHKCLFEWVSSAGGAADATEALEGQILRVSFIPDSGGTQPTNAYDITLKDSEAVDVLAGLGANLTNANATQVVPVLTDGTAGNMDPMVCTGTLTLAVTNAGNAKGGKVAVYYR